MSKAFVNEDAAVDEVQALPERPLGPLPITPQGFDALKDELAALDKSTWRARVLAQVLASVTVRAPALQSGGVGFGCTVVVARAHEANGARTVPTAQTIHIVGPDEAQPSLGRVSVTAPLARALLGQKRGAVVVVHKPNGDEELEIIDVRTP